MGHFKNRAMSGSGCKCHQLSANTTSKISLSADKGFYYTSEVVETYRSQKEDIVTKASVGIIRKPNSNYVYLKY